MIKITEEIERGADALSFAESGGGPLIALPDALLPNWWGTADEAGEPDESGESQYDQACEVEECGLLVVGKGHALVMDTPDITSFHPTEEGGLLIRWVGAETGAALLAAALLLSDQYETLEEVWQLPGGGMTLMDAGEDGREEEPFEPVVKFHLPKGNYALSRLDWEGEVEHMDGHNEELMLEVIKLERLQ